MLRFFKKGRTKKTGVGPMKPKSPQHKRSEQKHIRKKSTGSLQFGPNVTYSVSTDHSSGPSSFEGHPLVHVSSSASTHLRRNANEIESLDQSLSTSESAWSLVPPDGRAPATSSRHLEAEIQFAKLKLQQMKDVVVDPPKRATVHDQDQYISSEFPGAKDMPAISRDVVDLVTSESIMVTVSNSTTMLNDGDCDAHAVDDFIQTGMSLSTCGILSNYRPIFGTYDDDQSHVTDVTENAVKLGDIFWWGHQ